MRRLFSYLTPKTRGQIVGGMIVSLALIAGLNIAYHLIIISSDWRIIDMALNGLIVGGPFVIGFFLVADQQLKKLRILSLKSRKDGLTGLNNRHTFIELANRRLEDQPQGVLLLLDADHFKVVNDTYGHAVGDRCLEAIARHLKWNLRSEDVAGRIGGEEFAVLIAGVNIAQARVIGERMTRPIPFSGGPENPHLSITLSVGAAIASQDVSLDRLLIRADEALYAAKQAGRGCLKSWDIDDAFAA